MTKKELSDQISNDTSMLPSEIEIVLNSFTKNIKKAIASGENVYMRGFGSFINSFRKAKVARNITAGTEIKLPARNMVKFKPAPGFVASKLIILLIFVLASVGVMGQVKPKQHVYYDTVKNVQTRVDYSPDTIPVYFKELCIVRENIGTVRLFGKPDSTIAKGDTDIYERWQTGFVIWQTYHQGGVYGGLTLTGAGIYTLSGTDYYKDEYQPSSTMPGIFLYADRKTVVKNKVIYSFKR